MPPRGSSNKVTNTLVAVSSAAVLAVYSAGYVRTRSAADRFEVRAAERRPRAAIPVAEPDVPPAPKPEEPKPSAPVVKPGPTKPIKSPEPAPVLAVAEPATATP